MRITNSDLNWTWLWLKYYVKKFKTQTTKWNENQLRIWTWMDVQPGQPPRLKCDGTRNQISNHDQFVGIDFHFARMINFTDCVIGVGIYGNWWRWRGYSWGMMNHSLTNCQCYHILSFGMMWDFKRYCRTDSTFCYQSQTILVLCNWEQNIAQLILF